MFHVPNQFRNRTHPLLKSSDDVGNNGLFIIPHNIIGGYNFAIIASSGAGWEHVSVTLNSEAMSVNRCPTWEEMCHVKEIFWDDDDCVVQFHPPKKVHVNCHPYCLHLWKPTDLQIPTPPSWMIGITNK